MDLRDLLKEYWPIFAGVFAVLFTAIVFWPSDEPRDKGPIGAPVQAEVMPAEFLEREQERKAREREAQAKSRPEKPTAVEAQSAPPAEEEPQFLELVQAVPVPGKPGASQTYGADHPKVKKALSQVKVVLYEQHDCETCDVVRRFLEANDVSVSIIDVEEDENQRERARRLSGSPSLPVIVVDGIPVSGFSQEALQGALTQAVKSRVEAEP